MGRWVRRVSASRNSVVAFREGFRESDGAAGVGQYSVLRCVPAAWPRSGRGNRRRRFPDADGPPGGSRGCRSPMPLCFRAIPFQGRSAAGRGLGRCSAPACRRCPFMTFCRPARGATFTRKTAAIPGVPARKKPAPAGAGFRSGWGQGRPSGPAETLRLVEGRAVGSHTVAQGRSPITSPETSSEVPRSTMPTRVSSLASIVVLSVVDAA